ncbi:actin nucleation-promoting factor WASL-like [Ptychodera flava]|uniref:actin nucleation-promoting factor WASL-like n=1 Tax=Ptychodera flava TaxID=63121 RepID=UPI003969EF78
MSNRQQSTNAPQPQNVHSSLLTAQENEQLFNIIGKRCVSLATAILQVYFALPQSPAKWTKMYCGVGCFIKDNQQRSYFIRVYDIKKNKKIWEQELYNQFRYFTPKPFFHTFATDDCQAALNFANESEASSFKDIIVGKIQQKERRKTEKRRQRTMKAATTTKVAATVSPIGTIPTSPSAMHTVNLTKPAENSSTLKKKDKKKKDKGKKLTKYDIGLPSEFRHVGHVGWDPNKGYDVNNLDPEVKELFDEVGISESQLKDKETSKFIHDFIESQGGLDAIKRDRSVRAQPLPQPPPHATPETAPPLPPSRAGAAPAPPPPSRGDAPPPPTPSRGALPQPPTSRTSSAPPPPLPSRGASQPPPPPPAVISSPTPATPIKSPPLPPPPPSGGPPPPPPPPGPPPPPITGAAPPPPPSGPPPMPGGDGDSPSSRGALLSQIQGGAALKHIDSNERTPPVSADPRSNLMNQIRGGFTLKAVEQQERPPPQTCQTGMAGALARALAQRNAVIHSSDDDDDDDFDDDDEDWD